MDGQHELHVRRCNINLYKLKLELYKFNGVVIVSKLSELASYLSS